MVHAETILLAGALLALAVATSLVARRARVPGLVLFLALGILVGPHGLGVVSHVDIDVAQSVGVIALALILFEGGLASGWDEIRPVFGVSISLATIGAALTALITGAGAAMLLGDSTKQALLIGGIVASTDGAAVFALLRGSTLRKRLARILEAEAGLNDPVAIVLVIGVINWIKLPDYTAPDAVWLFVEQMFVGGVVGIAFGKLGAAAIRRVGNITTGLYPVSTVATAALAFGVAAELHGSGFLATYTAGIVLGSERLPAKRSISDFHDGVAWVSQIVVFLVLGLLFVPSSLAQLWDDAVIVTLLLMFVARPVAVFVSTLFANFEFREVALLQWAGMRGAVPIVLGTFPLAAGIADANAIFNIVFFVVLASALLQGTTFEWFATRLGLTTPHRSVAPPLIQAGEIRRLGAEFFEFPIREGDAIAGHVVAELQLPREALVSVIVRGDEALLPRGSTRLEVGDRLHILVRGYLVKRVEGLFDLWREGPIGVAQELVRPVAGHAVIFSVRPWRDEMGDAGNPEVINGVEVLRRVRTRHDAPGALMILHDGRYAVTGDGIVAAGSARQLRDYAVRRIEFAETLPARAWWREVAGAVA